MEATGFDLFAGAGSGNTAVTEAGQQKDAEANWDQQFEKLKE